MLPMPPVRVCVCVRERVRWIERERALAAMLPMPPVCVRERQRERVR
jgi:hypothetical protein